MNYSNGSGIIGLNIHKSFDDIFEVPCVSKFRAFRSSVSSKFRALRSSVWEPEKTHRCIKSRKECNVL